MEESQIVRQRNLFLRFLKDNKAFKAYVRRMKLYKNINVIEYIENYIRNMGSLNSIIVMSFIWNENCNFWIELNKKLVEYVKD